LERSFWKSKSIPSSEHAFWKSKHSKLWTLNLARSAIRSQLAAAGKSGRNFVPSRRRFPSCCSFIDIFGVNGFTFASSNRDSLCWSPGFRV
jgi:hypothetical protein